MDGSQEFLTTLATDSFLQLLIAVGAICLAVVASVLGTVVSIYSVRAGMKNTLKLQTQKEAWERERYALEKRIKIAVDIIELASLGVYVSDNIENKNDSNEAKLQILDSIVTWKNKLYKNYSQFLMIALKDQTDVAYKLILEADKIQREISSLAVQYKTAKDEEIRSRAFNEAATLIVDNSRRLSAIGAELNMAMREDYERLMHEFDLNPKRKSGCIFSRAIPLLRRGNT